MRFLFIFIFLTNIIFSDDRAIGLWLVSSNDGVIKLYKNGNELKGKIVWFLKSSDPKKNIVYDVNNPNPQLRNRLISDINILWNFKYDGKKWSNGIIYDARNGNEYSSYIEMINNNSLKLRGYLLFSFIGKSQLCKRISEKELDSIRATNP